MGHLRSHPKKICMSGCCFCIPLGKIALRCFLLIILPARRISAQKHGQWFLKPVEALHVPPRRIRPWENPFTTNEYCFTAEEYWFRTKEYSFELKEYSTGSNQYWLDVEEYWLPVTGYSSAAKEYSFTVEQYSFYPNPYSFELEAYCFAASEYCFAVKETWFSARGTPRQKGVLVLIQPALRRLGIDAT